MNKGYLEALLKAAELAPMDVSPVLFPETVAGREIHIDGDFLAYWAAAVAKGNHETARYLTMSKIRDFRLFCGAEKAVLHLTHNMSNKGYRYSVSAYQHPGGVKPKKLYQANRSKSVKPELWGFVRGILETYTGPEFTIRMWTDREADDGVSLAAHRCKEPIYIASKDKDFRMIPGVHCDWDTYMQTTVKPGDYEVIGDNGKVYGYKWFLLQLLQGDTADHIHGVGKITSHTGKQVNCGEVKAAELLEGLDRKEAEIAVLKAYRDMYGVGNYFLEFIRQALMLWMKTEENVWDIGNCLSIVPPEITQTTVRWFEEDVKEQLKEIKCEE